MRWPTRPGRPREAGLAWLLVGLGNPGPRYAGTRHNLGRDALDRLAGRHGIRLAECRFNARFGLGEVEGSRVCLAEPLTYMNLSGQAVAPLARFYQLPPERVLAVCDDLDLPLGALRLRAAGGSGGHNGLASLAAQLGSTGFPRLRLGIGRPPAGWDPADYVLARFGAEEQAAADSLREAGAEALARVLAKGLEAAMNEVNR